MTRAFAALAALALGATAGASGTAGAAAAARTARAAPPPVVLNTKPRRSLVLTTSGYRLRLSKDNGAIIELVDKRTGQRLLTGQAGCGWALSFASGDGFGACAFGRTGENRFSYRWAPALRRLTLRYEPVSEGRARASVTLVARPDQLDLTLTLEHHFGRPVPAVLFPSDLVSDAGSTSGIYTPTFLPGIKLGKGFLKTPHRNVERYPSRWAFADFVAADVGRSHLAVYSVNPPPSPLAPVDIGATHDADSGPCSGTAYCFTHAFQTWLSPDVEWKSPTVRLRVGGSVRESILAYRTDNGIDRFPSLEQKLGDRLGVLSRAPLVKADLWKGLPAFRDWGPELSRLPSPSLLHPVAFQEGGHDEDYPDFLPPEARWGSTDEFNAALDHARALGDLVMPYLNVSWWDTQAPTVRLLPAPLTPKDIAMQTSGGDAVTEQFGEKDGYIVSPYVPFVRDRIARLMDQWRTDVPAECVFFDQIGARPWRRDFNPAAPTPLAYQDGWLDVFSRYRDRCLMSEDGWDRLADSFVGFHGGFLQMEREHAWGDTRWGAGNWEPYPLALWLLHDKVLMYEHDLYPNTFTTDPEVLLVNVAFGQMLSYTWDGETDSLSSPWLSLVGRLQRLLGPNVAGRPLTAYDALAPDVTESRFGDYSVVANWSRSASFDYEGRRIAPLGFVAKRGDRVLAGVFGDSWAGVSFAATE